MRDDPSPDKPAWRILYETVTAPVRDYPVKPVIRIVERGPVRVALEITRQAGPSTIVQRVMLTADGDRVDVENDIDWKSTNTLLKAAFPICRVKSEGHLRPRPRHHSARQQSSRRV